MMKEKEIKILKKAISKLTKVRDYASRFKMKKRILKECYFFVRLDKIEKWLTEVIDLLNKLLE